jgi:hypothetical protein
MHGTIMVVLAVVPLSVGAFGNYLIPLQIGAPDMAFRRLKTGEWEHARTMRPRTLPNARVPYDPDTSRLRGLARKPTFRTLKLVRRCGSPCMGSFETSHEYVDERFERSERPERFDRSGQT